MHESPITEVIPIYTDEHGRMRVSGTRVLLDLVVHAYQQGRTPESIVESYPTLALDQVYLAIGYYLRHRAEVDAYIRRIDDEAEQFGREWEAANPQRIEQLKQRSALRAGTVNTTILLEGLAEMRAGLTDEAFEEIERAMNEEYIEPLDDVQ